MTTNKRILRQRLLGVAVATAASVVMAASVRAESKPNDIIGECGELENAPPCPADAVQERDRQPVRFKPWRAIWQCNDLRIAEWSNREGVIQYDLAGTVWGGSQFARDLIRDTLWFNGRPCARLR